MFSIRSGHIVHGTEGDLSSMVQEGACTRVEWCEDVRIYAGTRPYCVVEGLAGCVRVPRPHPDSVQDVAWDGLAGSLVTVACSAERLTRDPPVQMLYPSHDWGSGFAR